MAIRLNHRITSFHGRERGFPVYGPHHIPSIEELMEMSNNIDQRVAYQILYLAKSKSPDRNYYQAHLIRDAVNELKRGMSWDDLRWFLLVEWIKTK